MNNMSNPFSEKDIEYLNSRGISQEEASRQYNLLKKGTYYPSIIQAASLDYGIMKITDKELAFYLNIWEKARQSSNISITRFIPASGAASRMFRSISTLLDCKQPKTKDTLSKSESDFFEQIEHFAFYKNLNEVCLRNEWMSTSRLVSLEKYDSIIQNLLTTKGLDYLGLPKGLIPFHLYPTGEVRTPALEHLVEGSLIHKDLAGNVSIHFTIPTEKRAIFISHIEQNIDLLEEQYGVHYTISYSEQSSSTNTLSLDEFGDLVRTNNGDLLLRPGGHGSLIQNLEAISSDLVLIKNIDNVSPDHLKGKTITYTKLLGGILLAVQEKIFSYLKKIHQGKSLSHSTIEEMLHFLKEVLCIELQTNNLVGEKEMIERIYMKLNRPLRVCGMVPNEGEPGGGPFIVKEADGSTSLQILETSQINDASREILLSASHFNPVLMFCSLKDFQGNRFSLSEFIDSQQAFLSQKNYREKNITILEHPGLWNGSMARWNTLFVEVPNEVFTPVKTISDLLRKEHQIQNKENK